MSATNKGQNVRDSCDFTWFGQNWKCLRIKKKGTTNFSNCDPLKRTITLSHSYSETMLLDTLHNLLTNGATYLVGCSYGHNYPMKQEITVMNHAQMDMLSGAVRGAYEMIKTNILGTTRTRTKRLAKAMKDSCDFPFFGQTWKCVRVRRKDETFGGECDAAQWLISINEKYSDETFLDYLHHELIEGAAYQMNCDYTRFYPDQEGLFILTYSELEVLSSAVRGSYEDIKEKIKAVNGWLPVKSNQEKSNIKDKKSTKHYYSRTSLKSSSP